MIDSKDQIAPLPKCYKKCTPVRVDWGKKKKATILCGSSHQEVELISVVLELGHVTCFGQWFMSKYDVCRGLIKRLCLALFSCWET